MISETNPFTGVSINAEIKYEFALRALARYRETSDISWLQRAEQLASAARELSQRGRTARKERYDD